MNVTDSDVVCEFRDVYTIGAPRERVWRALTRSEELCLWFAERADVEPREGGAYRFWGRHTPSFGGAIETTQRIAAIEHARSLSFDWNWAGVATRCTIALRESEGGLTIAEIRHAFGGTIAHYSATVTSLIARDFWDVSMANLDEYVRVGRAVLMVDHTFTPRKDVALSIEIEAPAASVWAMLTEPSQIARWLARDKEFSFSPEVELRPGGRYTYGWQDERGEAMGPSRIIELEAGRRLVHDWCHAGDATERTEWTIEAIGPDRTRLCVRQVGTGSAREFNGYANGWAGFLLVMRHLPTPA